MNCKLVGSFIQHLEIVLSPGEDFYAERGSLISLDQGIQKEVKFIGNNLGKVISAKFSGESIFILRFLNSTSILRKIIVGSRCSILPIKLAGESILCKKGAYIASSEKMEISTKLSANTLLGGIGAKLQKITGVGTVFLGSIGHPIEIDIRSGDSIEIDENHLVALKDIPLSHLSASWSATNVLGGEGLSLLEIEGPGKVFISPGLFI